MEDQSSRTVRHWFERFRRQGQERLPPERVLAAELGLSRAELRKGLAELEADGALIRQVGRGTFLRPELVRQDGEDGGERAALPDMSPRQALGARLVLEPALARIAARETNVSGMTRLREAGIAFSEAGMDATREACDEAFHRAVALATGNPGLVDLYDRLVETRRAVAWGRLGEQAARARADDATREQHAAIVAAIADRDDQGAERAMAHHLRAEMETIMR